MSVFPTTATSILQQAVATMKQVEGMKEYADLARSAAYGRPEVGMIPVGEVVDTDNYTLRFVTHASNVSSATRDLYQAVGGGSPPTARTAVLRASGDPNINDFLRYSIASEVDVYSLRLHKANASGVAVDLVAKLMKDMVDSEIDEIAKAMNLPSNGRMGQINGTKKNADGRSLASSTTYTSGSTAARFQVDNAFLILFRPGTRVDIYNGATKIADNLEVAETPEGEESSIVVRITADTQLVSNLDALADNFDIYAANGYGQGSKLSLHGWFEQNPMPGESFLTRDRTNRDYSFLMIPSVRNDKPSAAISPTHFQAFANAMYSSRGPIEGGAVKVHLHHTLADGLKSRAVSQQYQVVTDRRDDGAIVEGLPARYTLTIPLLGREIELVPTTLGPTNSARLIDTSTWKRHSYAFNGTETLFDSSQHGARPDAAAGSSSVFYAIRKIGTTALVCYNPERNGVIANVHA